MNYKEQAEKLKKVTKELQNFDPEKKLVNDLSEGIEEMFDAMLFSGRFEVYEPSFKQRRNLSDALIGVIVLAIGFALLFVIFVVYKSVL